MSGELFGLSTGLRLFIFFFTPLVVGGFDLFAQAKREERIAKQMEIFYLKPEKLSPHDRIWVSGQEAFVDIWRDLPPNPEEAKVECLGYQWILAGRGKNIGQGAKSLFQSIPDLAQITLTLVEVDVGVKSRTGKGKLEKTSTPRPYFRVTAERSKVMASSYSQDQLKEQLHGSVEGCLKIGRELVSRKEIRL